MTLSAIAATVPTGFFTSVADALPGAVQRIMQTLRRVKVGPTRFARHWQQAIALLRRFWRKAGFCMKQANDARLWMALAEKDYTLARSSLRRKRPRGVRRWLGR